MYINCSEKELQILGWIAAAAESLGMPCYLVGGDRKSTRLNSSH